MVSVNVTEAKSVGSEPVSGVGPDADPRALPPVSPRPQVGRYALLERIGAGTMGEVWKASDPTIGRVVAVKLLRCPDGLDSARREEWERRFLLEARAAGRLAHPGIVAIHDAGQADDGRPFIVMEYVEGRSLDEYLKRGVRPEPARVLDWAAQVADALDHAHRQGIVHRDVKPANILVDREGRARLADFGIARLADSDLTREGAFLGSPAYAAPEQIRGLPVDGRTDLFSLGAVAYTLLTGSRPFEGNDLASLAYSICHLEPTPPNRWRPDLPPAIQAVVLKALAKDPARRHRFGSELAGELRAAASLARENGRNGSPAAATAEAERTLVDGASPAPSAPDPERAEAIEQRAAALGSAAAVGVVRAAAAVADGSRRAGTQAARAWAARAPQVAAAARRAGVVLVAACRGLARGTGEEWRARPRVVAAVVLAACGLLGATVFLTTRRSSDADVSPDPAARVSSFFRETVLRENVAMRVTHGLEAGQLTVWSDGNAVESLALETRKKKLAIAGRSLVSYGRETEDGSLRLPPGSHALSVGIASGDGKVNLVQKLAVEVVSGERYTLDVSVRSWPRPKLDVDWRRSAAREGS